MFSSTNAQTSRIETAAALWRRIMPTPRPRTGASVVSTSPHSAVDAIPDVSPFASPPRMAPLRPPIIPRIPIANPKLAATVVLDATITHRAGCAATAVAMVPC